MCDHSLMISNKEESHKKKKNNTTWTGFSIPLILLNLLLFLVNPLIFLLPLAPIDCIAVFSFWKKQSPPWIVFMLSLLAVNIIFFYFAGLTLNQTAGGVAGFFVLPIALVLLLIDSLAISTYIYIHLPNGRAKGIFYIALASIALGLLALSFLFTHQ